MKRRKFNCIYASHKFRVGVQFMLADFQSDGWALSLTPRISLAHNYRATVAVGLDWIFGSVNFFVMSKDFVTSEKDRFNRVADFAAKLNITTTQQKLRWDGY